MYLDTVKQQLQQLGLVQPDELVWCTASEISKLEQELGSSLSKAYQEFLLEMGHGAGQFLRGSDCFFKHLPYLREWAIDLLGKIISHPYPMMLLFSSCTRDISLAFLSFLKGMIHRFTLTVKVKIRANSRKVTQNLVNL